MKKYRNITGNSGITAYDISLKGISVEFNYDAVYLYTYSSAGKKVIEKMKQLATEGQGLSTYISQYVKDKFETQLK